MICFIVDNTQEILENIKSTGTGHHFNLTGHSAANLRFSVLEKISNKSEAYRKNREAFYIERFNTKYKGLNRNQKR